MATEDSANVVREAGASTGLLECYHITRSKLGFDSCVVVSAKYNATGSLLNRQTLYSALSAVIQQHAALSVQVRLPRDPKDRPLFTRLPSVALDDVVSFVDGGSNEESLASLIQTEMSKPLKLGATTPLWRLTVSSGRTVLFVYHHGIGDGQSGLAFHRALVSALNKATGGPIAGSLVPTSDNLSLVPPVEDLTNVGVSWRSFFQILYDTFAPFTWTKKASSWSGNPVVSTPTNSTSVRCWELSAADAAKLIVLCREHHTTLTAFLHTLLVGLLSRHVIIATATDKRLPRTVATSVSVSLRRFTGASPNVVCDEAAGFQSLVPIAPLGSLTPAASDFPWTTAAQYASRLQAGVAGTREAIGTIRYLFNLGMTESFWTGALGKKRGEAVELSNLGRFVVQAPEDDAAEAPWDVSAVHFAQCNATAGAALKVNVAGSPNGAVSVVFTWGEGALDHVVAEAVVREVRDAVASILA
ncbi:hypothetical protein PHLGIDRAFT_511908 [Phlebiopsis gigantea 11061_1 CR5-6]|uniref:Condensation domain-containing protein n=1 Tax=Phlebiopsis gigantea (strain 11061_1 CR5-6) TaxID=745531 RepID=A0A0C3RZ08_PHLG1|nr:hypothetical protein PHLGIDRAFT_511908 [Phlebiopsis gigantea 11061_1 CR5-6]